MIMQAVKQEILDAVKGKFLQGDSFRMVHRFRTNGDVCTEQHKTPAMTVTRISNGWVFHCHRCHYSGTINDKTMNPTQTRAKMEALQNLELEDCSSAIRKPSDFVSMKDRYDSTDIIPFSAYNWLWSYDVKGEALKTYNIGWSPIYNRIIIPIYEYIYSSNGTTSHELVGWVGRDVQKLTKEERVKNKCPKYLTRTDKNKRRFFTCPGDQHTVVICEDCLSAIRINEASGYTTIALLNASVGNDLLRWLRSKVIYLWLDSDMLAESVKQADRMKQLGLDTKRISTPKDPKCYNELYIKEVLSKKNP